MNIVINNNNIQRDDNSYEDEIQGRLQRIASINLPDDTEPAQREEHELQLWVVLQQLQDHQEQVMTKIMRDLRRLEKNDPSFTNFTCHLPQHKYYFDNFHNWLAEALAHSIHLRRLDLRPFMVNEENAQAVASGIGQSNLTSIYITDWIHPTREGLDETRRMLLWQALYQGLQASRSIQELCFKNLTIDAAEGLGQSLPLIQSLRKLVLDNPIMTEASAHSIAGAISHSTLESLTLNLGAIAEEEEDIPTVRQILYQGIIASQTIRELSFESVRVEHIIGLGDALPLMKSLRKLDLNIVSLNEPGVQALGRGICKSDLKSLIIRNSCRSRHNQLLYDVLRRSNSITTLELRPANHYDFTHLAEGMRHNTAITSLLLGSDYISKRNITLLFAQGLRHNTTLTHLKFQNCRNLNVLFRLMDVHWHAESAVCSLSFHVSRLFGSFDARTLLRAVAKHPAMRELELSNSFDFVLGKTGYDVLKIIGEELPNQQHLTHVNLSGCACWVTVDNATFLETQLQERARLSAGRALILGMQNNLHIQQINVQGNDFSSIVEHEIGYYASLNRALLFVNRGLPVSVWSMMLIKCQRQDEFNHSRTFFCLREQPHIVQPLGTTSTNTSGRKRARSDEDAHPESG
jgi:hypothetical protein